METLDFKATVERLRQKQAAAGVMPEPFQADPEDVLKAFGVPRRIRRQLPPKLQTPALEAVRAWALTDSWVLILSGGVGLGKSFAAAWWLSTGADGFRETARLSRRWWPAHDIVAADYYRDGLNVACSVGRLVIDDMGPEYADGKGMLNAKVDRIIDARYREERKTIITTNLPKKVFEARYRGRFASRVSEGGRWLKITGEDLRGGR